MSLTFVVAGGEVRAVRLTVWESTRCHQLSTTQANIARRERPCLHTSRTCVVFRAEPRRAQPTFFAAAILALGLGIAAATAIFSVINRSS